MKLDRTTRLILAGSALASIAAVVLSISAAVASMRGLDLKASDFISLFALVVSAFAFGRPWWNERKASIEVRSEQYRRIRGDRVDDEQRYVVKNHGPAQAHSVEVTFFREGNPVKVHLTGWNPRTHTPLLQPGEELHMNLVMAQGDQIPEKVVVTWWDRRARHQSQEFYPSMRNL